MPEVSGPNRNFLTIKKINFTIRNSENDTNQYLILYFITTICIHLFYNQTVRLH